MTVLVRPNVSPPSADSTCSHHIILGLNAGLLIIQYSIVPPTPKVLADLFLFLSRPPRFRLFWPGGADDSHLSCVTLPLLPRRPEPLTQVATLTGAGDKTGWEGEGGRERK